MAAPIRSLGMERLDAGEDGILLAAELNYDEVGWKDHLQRGLQIGPRSAALGRKQIALGSVLSLRLDGYVLVGLGRDDAVELVASPRSGGLVVGGLCGCRNAQTNGQDCPGQFSRQRAVRFHLLPLLLLISHGPDGCILTRPFQGKPLIYCMRPEMIRSIPTRSASAGVCNRPR